LISNAFKYTHEGFVEYGYEIVNETGIRFFVNDTGVGISREYQKKIFERFIQEPKPLSTMREGTGLGLPITQSLISKLGGKIWVESALGKGSSFFFELPDIIVSDESESMAESDLWKEKQVLIIEDEIVDYIALEEHLKGKVRLHYLNNPELALEYYSSSTSVDLCMIGWDNKQDLKILKEIKEKDKSQVLIGMIDSSLKGKSRQKISNHFHELIDKPIKKTELFKMLKKYLG
jgi:hypothetical protein